MEFETRVPGYRGLRDSLLGLLLVALTGCSPPLPTVPYTTLLEEIEARNVVSAKIDVESSMATVIFLTPPKGIPNASAQTPYRVEIMAGDDEELDRLLKLLRDKGVEFHYGAL